MSIRQNNLLGSEVVRSAPDISSMLSLSKEYAVHDFYDRKF